MKEERHAKLSWLIIEHKILYYAPRGLSEDFIAGYAISDAEYDDMEKEYLGLCRDLGFSNSVVHKKHPGYEDVLGDGMNEVDFSRPSVQLAYEKLFKLDKKDKE